MIDPPAIHVFCSPTAAILSAAKSKYGEVPVGVGPTNQGQIAVLLVDPADGSWTLVLQMPGDLMCVIAAGEAWRAVKPVEGRES